MHSNALRVFIGNISKNVLKSEHCATVKIKFPTSSWQVALCLNLLTIFVFRLVLIICFSTVHLFIKITCFYLHLFNNALLKRWISPLVYAGWLAVIQKDKPFISSCRKLDLLVGAPLFMDRGSDGKLREVGQVYVYLGKGGFTFNNAIKLTGSEIYARYGSSICSVGDLNMDGYNGTFLTCQFIPCICVLYT